MWTECFLASVNPKQWAWMVYLVTQASLWLSNWGIVFYTHTTCVCMSCCVCPTDSDFLHHLCMRCCVCAACSTFLHHLQLPCLYPPYFDFAVLAQWWSHVVFCLSSLHAKLNCSLFIGTPPVVWLSVSLAGQHSTPSCLCRCLCVCRSVCVSNPTASLW